MMIIAHRGVTEFGDHENTISAFKKAIELNLSGIELDIRRTKDLKFVVHHDDNVNGYIINDHNYNEILEISSNLNYEIPLLEDVLTLCKGKIFLDIELKETGYEKEICDFVLSFLDYNEFCFRSFNDISIKRIKQHNSKVICGLLLGVGKTKYPIITRLSELFPMIRILKCKCDFVSPHFNLIHLFYITRMHILKKPVIAWTVNRENLMKKYIKHKIDGIITDKVSTLIDVYNK